MSPGKMVSNCIIYHGGIILAIGQALSGTNSVGIM